MKTTPDADGASGFPQLRVADISAPKGGGAIQGMGEKWTVAASGAASLTIPIGSPSGRSDFGPQLALHYDTGSGNGDFGIGWSLGLASITRRTDKGLPRYLDADDSDIFILSGAEDLTPLLVETAAGWVREMVPDRQIPTGTYRITRYRPRIEGAFARIEQWRNTSDPSDIFWRTISKDNVSSWYGRSGNSRIADPADPSRIFSWLIEASVDDKGNAVSHEYQAEDSRGVSGWNNVSEAARDGAPATRTALRHIKRIHYGNKTSALVQPDLTQTQWLFEIVFDYGEDHLILDQPDAKGNTFATASTQPAADWPLRADPFSTRRAGFEIRNYRLCQRILVFHHFDELENGNGTGYLARSTDFTYVDDPVATTLISAQSCGYVWHAEKLKFLRRTLPSLDCTYSSFPTATEIAAAEVQELSPEAVENLPYGLKGPSGETTLWTDLKGEGISGILVRQDGALGYKRNLGDGHFAPLQTLDQAPAEVAAGAPASLQDVTASGQLDWVVDEGVYAQRVDAATWQYRAFDHRPALDRADPSVHLGDQTGDGLADLLIVEGRRCTLHRSLGERGFEDPVIAFLPPGEPPTPPIYMIDMTGDGLPDIVTVRPGEITYYPSLGNGRFGAAITMAQSPSLDGVENFDPARLRFIDIDGSGPVDLLYFSANSVRLHRNQNGNGYGEAILLPGLAGIGLDDDLSVVDLLGQGTPCLVWSSCAADRAGRPIRFVDPMSGVKPHLLTGYANNLGAEVAFHHVSSTHFYLEDERVGDRWVTRLPFPVQVVDRIETIDRISRTRLVSRYAYHHGYFDPVEREFRGFGLVDRWDGEQLAALEGVTAQPGGAALPDIPRVHVRTWYHTGAYFGRDRISRYFAGTGLAGTASAYFREPGLSDAQAALLLLPDTVLPTGLDTQNEREACRALKGAMLRQESYAEDGSGVATLPYAVTEQNFSISCLQPRDGRRHGVFHIDPREKLQFHYDRSLDPRVEHDVTLETDAFGNVLSAVKIAYGRRADSTDPALDGQDRDRQRLTFILAQGASFTNAILGDPDDYRAPQPAETSAWEIRKATQDRAANGITALFAFDDVAGMITGAGDGNHDILPEDEDFTAAVELHSYYRRLNKRTRTLYRPDDLGDSTSDATQLLPLGEVEAAAYVGESFQLTFTAGLIEQVLARDGAPLLANPLPILASVAGDGGGYVAGDDLRTRGLFPVQDPAGNWWASAGRLYFSIATPPTPASETQQVRAHFRTACRKVDPFGAATTVTYDNYDLLPVETADALGNLTSAGVRQAGGAIDPTVPGNDYRVLKPARITDPNRNVTESLFDALGLLVATAVRGKPEQPGDTVVGAAADLDAQTIANQFDNPAADPMTALGNATTRLLYDLDAYQRSVAQNADPQPARMATFMREIHSTDPGGANSPVMVSVAFSDGFGRVVQTKQKADKGPLTEGGGDVEPRWATSGWQIVSPRNGKPVFQYEPFYSAVGGFEFAVMAGVSPVLFYDPVDRLIATLHADHSYEKVVFGPWDKVTFDCNDTCAVRNAETGDPATDPDVAPLVGGYLAALGNWQTWYAARSGGALGPDEQRVATRAAAHADTPTSEIFDALGRPFLTVARNRTICPGHPLDGREEIIRSRDDLDIEGRQRAVRDERYLPVAYLPTGPAEQRIIMRYAYDLLGNRLLQTSIEAGSRWTLGDVLGKPIRGWDSRGHAFVTQYDPLRRPLVRTVSGTGAAADQRTLNGPHTIERFDYGETLANPEVFNLRGRIFQHADGAGTLISGRFDQAGDLVAAYDFKGNALAATRQLLADATAIPDWTALADEAFESRTIYDAVNRAVQTVAPRETTSGVADVTQNTFDRVGRLAAVHTWLQRTPVPDALLDPTVEPPSAAGVTAIIYDPKGQRQRVDHANGVSTSYTYDTATFRLTRLVAQRPAPPFQKDASASPNWPGGFVQNLAYTYDPTGNIITIKDTAQQAIFFRNRYVEPSNDYVYDATYRLVQASGREHLGLIGTAHRPPTAPDAVNAFHTGLHQPGDGKALGTYTERYVYDAVGNFLQMQHRSSDPGQPGWTRSYSYAETSLIEDGSGGGPARVSNRVSGTTLDASGSPSVADSYLYDLHGNMTRLPHLGGAAGSPNMMWDYQDRLIETVLGGGGNAVYTYDASGERVRKLWHKGGRRFDERIYLETRELFRRHDAGAIPDVNANTIVLERETFHLIDDTHRVALIETRTKGTATIDKAPRQLVRYQLTSHIGSSCIELSDVCEIISYEEYAPYGSTTYQGTRNKLDAPKRYRFNGRERDGGTGLDYHTRRYLATWLGRWISSDPIGVSDGPNTYQYVSANPIRKQDNAGTKGLEQEFAEQAPNIRTAAPLVIAAGTKIAAELGPTLLPITGTIASTAAGVGVAVGFGYLAYVTPDTFNEPGMGAEQFDPPTDAGVPLPQTTPETVTLDQPTTQTGIKLPDIVDAPSEEEPKKERVLYVDYGRYALPGVEYQNIQNKYKDSNEYSRATGSKPYVTSSPKERWRDEYLKQFAADNNWSLDHVREYLRGVAVDEIDSLHLGGTPQLERQQLNYERINSIMGVAEKRAIRKGHFPKGTTFDRIVAVKREKVGDKYRKYDWYRPFNRRYSQ